MGISLPTEFVVETLPETHIGAHEPSLQTAPDTQVPSAPKAHPPREPATKAAAKVTTRPASRPDREAPATSPSAALLATASVAVPSPVDANGSAASMTPTPAPVKASSAMDCHGTLSNKPRLLSSGAACQGVLHGSALSAPTKVTLVLRIDKKGNASPTTVLAESNAKVPGLEVAAQRCAQRLRFAPAHAQDGSVVAASSVVKLTFSNHYTATLPRSTKSRHGAI